MLKVVRSCRSLVKAVSSYELDTHPLPLFLTFLHCLHPSFHPPWLKSSCNSTPYCVLEVGTIPSTRPVVNEVVYHDFLVINTPFDWDVNAVDRRRNRASRASRCRHMKMS